ncbi:Sterile alpha motif containing protein [Oryctes borbonicus]|uniref:Sterile alpha motif containing protein n=1 Tax=Oryctes borbonicus TaxID=1629725 RepID=A0A0T6AWU5_9SCAR|nr:Sterile alpha motif containing protein [Oryctes borbonicus]
MRNSSGTLLSPEVDTGGGESDGFYLLKKDSQRRTTLSKVFSQDGSKICDLWLSKIRSKFLGETVLTAEHLMRVIQALKDFLTDQTKNTLHNTISNLRTEFCLDEGALNQLQLAIYLFQESVNEVLRLHPIKPHWMFALDNLVRQCAEAALSVIAPDLGDHLASTVNSQKSSKSTNSFDMRDQILQLKEENNRLTQEFLVSQKQYQVLLKDLIDQTQLQGQALRQVLANLPRPAIQEELEPDPKLAQWLEGLGLHRTTREIFLSQGFTLEEVLHDIQREDLQRIGLKVGSEFKIWVAISQYRSAPAICNGTSTPTY